LTAPPLTLTLSPLRGEGTRHARPDHFASVAQSEYRGSTS
jgi:hypothetical protein